MPISLAIISARSIELLKQSLNCAVLTCGIDQIGFVEDYDVGAGDLVLEHFA